MTIHNKQVFLKNLTYACVALIMAFAEAQAEVEDVLKEEKGRAATVREQMVIIDKTTKKFLDRQNRLSTQPMMSVIEDLQEKERDRSVTIQEALPIIEEQTEKLRDGQNRLSNFLSIFSRVAKRIKLAINEKKTHITDIKEGGESIVI